MRTYINLFITMLLGGLWHGASWNFVLWGGLHGSYLAVHRVLQRNGTAQKGSTWANVTSNKRVAALIAFGGIGLTFLLVTLTWVFFRARDLSLSLDYFKHLFGTLSFRGFNIEVIFCAALIFALDVTQRVTGRHTWLVDCKIHSAVKLVIVLMLAVAVLISAVSSADTAIPFVYFQF